MSIKYIVDLEALPGFQRPLCTMSLWCGCLCGCRWVVWMSVWVGVGVGVGLGVGLGVKLSTFQRVIDHLFTRLLQQGM